MEVHCVILVDFWIFRAYKCALISINCSLPFDVFVFSSTLRKFVSETLKSNNMNIEELRYVELKTLFMSQNFSKLCEVQPTYRDAGF